MSRKHKYPKAIRAQFRALWYQAYEREMAQALTQLAARFEEWQAGELDALALNELVHKHHNGAAREIYKRYNDGFNADDMTVAGAVARGIFSENDIPDDVWPHIADMVAFFRGE